MGNVGAEKYLFALIVSIVVHGYAVAAVRVVCYVPLGFFGKHRVQVYPRAFRLRQTVFYGLPVGIYRRGAAGISRPAQKTHVFRRLYAQLRRRNKVEGFAVFYRLRRTCLVSAVYIDNGIHNGRPPGKKRYAAFVDVPVFGQEGHIRVKNRYSAAVGLGIIAAETVPCACGRGKDRTFGQRSEFYGKTAAARAALSVQQNGRNRFFPHGVKRYCLIVFGRKIYYLRTVAVHNGASLSCSPADKIVARLSKDVFAKSALRVVYVLAFRHAARAVARIVCDVIHIRPPHGVKHNIGLSELYLAAGGVLRFRRSFFGGPADKSISRARRLLLGNFRRVAALILVCIDGNSRAAVCVVNKRKFRSVRYGDNGISQNDKGIFSVLQRRLFAVYIHFGQISLHRKGCRGHVFIIFQQSLRLIAVGLIYRYGILRRLPHCVKRDVPVFKRHFKLAARLISGCRRVLFGCPADKHIPRANRFNVGKRNLFSGSGIHRCNIACKAALARVVHEPIVVFPHSV